MRNAINLLFLSLAFFLAVACGRQEIYKDPSQPVEARVEDLLKRMTLDEKIEQLGGDSTGFEAGWNRRLGIPGIKMTDGPVGVRWGKATAFPASIGMAATWDTTLIHKVGTALGEETKARGRNFLLAGCVNLHRLPVGGRNFESFGEDPYLSSRLIVPYVKGIQEQGEVGS